MDPRITALLLEEDKHIETLKIESEGLKQDKEALKEMHKSYMVQMQTLINKKQIETPGVSGDGENFGNKFYFLLLKIHCGRLRRCYHRDIFILLTK